MFHRARQLVAVGIVGTLVLPLPAALATTTDSELDEITVTVSRRATGADAVSSAYALADASDTLQSTLPTDALADLPGVFVQQTTPGQGAVLIRGLRGSSVLHLVDGMRLNNAIFRDAPTQYFALVPSTAVTRIETVRGTAASLYGSDAVGGVAQVVTRRPSFDTDDTDLDGFFSATLNSAEQLRQVRAGVDIGNQVLAGTFSIETIDTGDRKIAGGDRLSPSGYRSRGARAALVFAPSKDVDWYVDTHFLTQPATPRIDELIAGFGQTQPNADEFVFAPNSRRYALFQRKQRNGWLGLDWNTSVSWQRIDDDRRSRDNGSRIRLREQNRSDLFGTLTTAGRNTSAGSWLVGFEYYHDRVSSARTETDIDTGNTVTALPRFPDDSSLTQGGVFWHTSQRFNSNHALHGGMRGNHIVARLPEFGQSSATQVSTTDVAGDLGWQWSLNDRWQTLANLGAGFRAPNIFDLGTLGPRPGNRFNQPNPELDSERIVQLDLGVRFDNGRIKFETFVFALNYTDRITTRDTGERTAEGRDIVTNVNAAQSKIYGVEMALRAAVNTRISLDANLTYTRGEQQRIDATEPADRIPPLTGRFLLDYAISDSISWRNTIRFAAQQDRLSARDVRDPRINPNGTAGWGELNTRLDWSLSDATKLLAGIDNLLDQRYRPHGSGLDAPGRNFFVTLSHRW
ncbi:MAG: TonB-dependent receptor [Pseudomonadota bacterium]